MNSTTHACSLRGTLTDEIPPSPTQLRRPRIAVSGGPTRPPPANHRRVLTLIEQVRKDLERGLKNPRTGRNGIAPSQVLRSLVLMRVKNWDYRELRERITSL